MLTTVMSPAGTKNGSWLLSSSSISRSHELSILQWDAPGFRMILMLSNVSPLKNKCDLKSDFAVSCAQSSHLESVLTDA